jgi:alanine racemase
VRVGDRVVLWGDPANGVPGAEDWAVAAGTIGYEIVTRVGPRVPRVPRVDRAGA